MYGQIVTFGEDKSFSEQAAGFLNQLLPFLIDCNGMPVMALSGGTTPGPLYTRMAEFPEIGCFKFIQVDERNVPASDDRSNQKMIVETLFKPGSHARLDMFFPVNVCPSDPGKAVEEYNSLLSRQVFSENVKRIGISILGMGCDGHTASLFPGTDWSNNDKTVLYRLFHVDKLGEYRYSSSFSFLAESRLSIFLVTGNEKKSLLKDITDGNRDDLPAAKLARSARTVWITD